MGVGWRVGGEVCLDGREPALKIDSVVTIPDGGVQRGQLGGMERDPLDAELKPAPSDGRSELHSSPLSAGLFLLAPRVVAVERARVRVVELFLALCEVAATQVG